MLPEVGASELVVLAAVALIVVGPKDLPVLFRKLGQFLTRIRGMAAEFRSSFDEMARQSELDDLRKEVNALRQTKVEDVVGPVSEWKALQGDIVSEHLYGDAGYTAPETSTAAGESTETVTIASEAGETAAAAQKEEITPPAGEVPPVKAPALDPQPDEMRQ